MWLCVDWPTLGSFMNFKKRSSNRGQRAGVANHERTEPTQGDPISTRGDGVVLLAWCGSMSSRVPGGHQKYQQRWRADRSRQVSAARRDHRCRNATAPLAGRWAWNEGARERHCTSRRAQPLRLPRVRVCGMRALASPEEWTLVRRSAWMASNRGEEWLLQLMRSLNGAESGRRRSALQVLIPNNTGCGSAGDEPPSYSRYPFSGGPQPL